MKEKEKKEKPNPIWITKFTMENIIKHLITILRIEGMCSTKLEKKKEIK